MIRTYQAVCSMRYAKNHNPEMHSAIRITHSAATEGSK